MSGAGTPDQGSQNGTGEPALEPSDAQVEVAHEALVRRWPRVGTWMETNRAGLDIRQAVADASDAWIKNGASRTDRTLLAHSGDDLADAGSLARGNTLTFNKRELAYLDACLAQQTRIADEAEAQRQRALTRKTRQLLLVIGLLVLALVASVFVARLSLERREQAQVNLAQALAAQAQLERERGQDERAALLARQAYAYDEDGEIQGTVGTALQATVGAPYFSIVTGAQELWVSSLAFSPDGRRLASASSDATIALLSLDDPRAPQTMIPDQPAWVPSVAFHPEPRRDLLASGGADGTVRLWRGASGESAGDPLLGPGGEVSAVAFDGGQYLAAGSCTTKDGQPPSTTEKADKCANGGAVVRIWALDRPDQPLERPELQQPDRTIGANRVCALAYSPDGRWLAAGGCDPLTSGADRCTGNAGHLVLWDMTQPDRPAICLAGHEGDVSALAFSPDNEQLASGGADRSLRLWDIAALAPLVESTSAQPLRVLGGHDEPIRSLAYSADGQVLASGSQDGSVGVWNMGDAEPVIGVLGNTTEWVRAVAFGGSSGRTLAAASAGGKIRIWDLAKDVVAPSILPGHTAYVRSLAFAPIDPASPPRLASAAEDGTVRIWTPGQPNIVERTIQVEEGSESLKVSSVSFDRNGNRLAIGSADGSVRVWDPAAADSAPVQIGDFRAGTVIVAFSPTADLFVSGTAAATVQFWDPIAGIAVGTRLPSPPGPVAAMAFSPDGQILAVAFSPNAASRSAGVTRGTIQLWDLSEWHACDGSATPTSSECSQTPPVLTSFSAEPEATALAFNRDGSLLAAGGTDGMTRIWDVAEERVAHLLPGHDAAVRSVAFSPDGTMLATGSNDQTVLIWDTARFDALPVRIADLAEWVRAVAFSPDSETLAAASTQGTVRLAMPRTQSLADFACERVTRNLDETEWVQVVGEKEDRSLLEQMLGDNLRNWRPICENLPPGRDRLSGSPEAAYSQPRTMSRYAPAPGASSPSRPFDRTMGRTGPGVRSVGTRCDSQPPIVSAAVRKRPIGPECCATISA